MDGYDKERTSWQRNETLLSPDTVGRMKLLWKVRLDNQPRQMHNLFPALIVGDVATAHGTPRDWRSSRACPTTSTASTSRRGTQIWKRQFDSTFKDDGSSRAYVLCPGGLTATPIVVPTATPGQVHGLRDLVGRPAAPARCRDRGRDGARRAVPAAQRQAVRAELPRQRPVHDDRAGLRWQPEPVLLVRPGDEEGRQLQSGQRRTLAATRAVHREGRPRVRRQRRRRLLPRSTDLRPGDHRGQTEPGNQGDGDAGLVRAGQRVLAAQARPRHQRDRAGLRVQGPRVHRAVEQGMPHLAARHQRARRRGPSHAGHQTPLVCNEEVHFCGRRACGARWRRGRTPTARGGC